MGISAQDILAQDPEVLRRQVLMREMQTLNPQGTAAGAIGALLGRGLGNVASGQGFFAVNDPALQRAAKVRSIQTQIAQSGETDPTKLATLFADELAKDPELAPFSLQVRASIKPKAETSPFAKIDPKDYTPDSLRAFAQTGDVAVLTPREKPTARYRTLSPAEARARGLNPDNVYQLEEGTEKVTQIGQGPSVVFNAPLVGAEKAYAADVGKANAQRDLSQFGAAEAAVENLNKLNTTLEELKSGEAFTGAFAELQTNIQKVQAKFAADKKAGKRVSDTEYLDALLGSDVFPMISALGIGARGLDTPAERDFLRQVMTGTIKLERDTLIRLTEDRKRIAERAIDRFNQRVEKGELDDFFKYQNRQPQKFEKPKPPERPRTPAQAPAGVDQRIWNAMTPEEKALWQ